MAVKCIKSLATKSRPTQSQKYIVIHNAGGGTAKTVRDYFEQCLGPNPEAGRAGICAHYSVDQDEIYQILEDNWNGQHTKGNGHYAPWGQGLPKGTCTNANAIGIEIADGSSVDFDKATDNAIELIRYLMKTYNIPIENVVRHGDTQDKPCPYTTMKKNLWGYMKETIKSRNDANTPIAIDTSTFTTAGSMVDTGTSSGSSSGTGGSASVSLVFANNGYTTAQESLPNANTSDNWVDMHKIKGLTLHMYPPYHNCSVDAMKEYFKYYNWNRAFHYKVDYDTEIDYSKKVPTTSGPFTGGNTVGTSVSDVTLVPGEGVYSGTVIGAGGGTSAGTGTSTPAGTIDGNDVPAKIYNYCSSKGATKAVCCAIIGNCEGESGFDPKQVTPPYTAVGLFQWLKGSERFASLEKKAKAAGKEWTDPDVQIQHMWDELAGEETVCASLLKKQVGGFDAYIKMEDPYQAAVVFGKCFERGGYYERRGQLGKKWFDKIDSYISNSSGSNNNSKDDSSKDKNSTTSKKSAKKVMKVATYANDIEESDTVYGWPIPGIAKVSSAYGYRECEYHDRFEMHGGIDIPADQGENVHAYAEGVVVESRKDASFGYVVKLKHADGCYTYYAHMLSLAVSIGQTVASGDVVGKVGHTGETDKNHLHFELYLDDMRVNPLIYVKPGGGSRKIPEPLQQIAVYTVGATEDKVTKDNVNRSKICFACADNNQHTYIDRALFNNQNPKYTVSIGAFFETNTHAVEKDKKYDWEDVEKKIIKQCAQALYFEGFTADNLWREFDLNRAPSPFVYLDRDKWKKFLIEVDKQVTWLVKKYGQVHGTYVPYNLLTNTNLNEFIDLSPDLGMNGNVGTGTGTGNTTLASAAGGFWLGDSITVLMKSCKLLDDQKVVANGGWAANSYYKKDGNKVDKTASFPKPSEVKYVFVLLGVNNPIVKYQKDLLDKLISMYPGLPIYVGEVLPTGKNYHYSSKWGSETAATLNPKIKTFNSEIQAYCNQNSNLNWISTTAGLLKDGYLDPNYVVSDNLHPNTAGLKKLSENIKAAISGSSNTGTTNNNNNNNNNNTSANALASSDFVVFDSPFDIPTAYDNGKDKNDKPTTGGDTPEYNKVKADPANINKYAYVGDDATVNVYAKTDETSKVVEVLQLGDEALITDIAKEYYYKVKANNKVGYVPSVSLYIISANKFGYVNTEKKNHEAWIKYDDTDLYKSTKMDTTVVTTDSQTRVKILDMDEKNGFYQVSILDETNKDKTGWVKAYRITFNKHEFTVEKADDNEDKGMMTKEIEIQNPDFEGSPTGVMEKYPNVQTTDGSLESWDKEGDVEFLLVKNADFGEPDRWKYRGNYFARIRSIKSELAGIKQEIDTSAVDSDKSEFALRVSAWIKLVTSDDEPGAIDVNATESYIEDGLTYYIVNKNNKVVASSKFALPNDTTKFARRTALLTGFKKDDKYSLVIGSKKPFDIYIDDISVEKVYNYKDKTKTDDNFTTGNIGTAGVGATAYDNGGIMIYTQDKAKGTKDAQPTIKTVVTNKEYEEIMSYSNYELIDTYMLQFEPYDKGLDEVLNAPVLEDDRLNTLTESLNTLTGNSIHYNVVEAGPGSTDHCVKPADELNVLYQQTEVKCDPIYPDLIIPPNYSTSDYDMESKNSIPLQALQDGKLKNEEILKKQFSFDYDTLEDKEKKSKGKPINYNDPYPYDDRITELEQHFPKIKVDEIESRLYSCNHPGCPLAHPMAKNFAMLNDMQLAQSKKIEQRLVRIENVLATMVRNIGRVGSRINVNCVYYGGQDVFGKYKTIRCLCDDRVNDGASVTIDQCMCCTRYEPIIGQIYDILDETGFNGSAILDDMQMSYMNLDDFKNLNKVENRASSFSYADVSLDPDKKPGTLIDQWKKEDKKAYLEQLKKKLGDDEKAKAELEKSLESDYVFTMNWETTEVDTQAPDVKAYPTEGIASKYLKDESDGEIGEIDTSNLDKKLDADVIAKYKDYNTINRGEWVDTREEADTTQSNNYTSEDFYFENFNANRTGYAYDNGLKGYIGLESSGSMGSVSNGLTGAECRNKIVEYVKKVCQENTDRKATYNNSPRTVDPNDIKYYKGTLHGCTNPALYDCTSLVSTAYKYAGLSSLYNKRASDNSLVSEIVNNDGDMWYVDEEGLNIALPGDVIMVSSSKVNPDSVKARKIIQTHHAMVYLGKDEDGDHIIGHASGPYNPPKAIRIDKWGPGHYAWGYSFFVRSKELKEADKVASSSAANGTGVQEATGTVDGNNYVCVLNKCRLTNYGPWCGSVSITADGSKTKDWYNKGVAAHNMPIGTKLYIPDLKGKVNSDGIFTVKDTGGYCFDFDVLTKGKNNDIVSEKSYKVYVLSWGSGKVTSSFTAAKKVNDKKDGTEKYKAAWNAYKTYGGSTMELLKFNQEDANIKNQSWY